MQPGPRQARHRSRVRQDVPDGIPGQLTGPALRLLIGVSVYREPIGRNALLFQIGQAEAAGLPSPASSRPICQGPVPPYHAPADLADLISECEEAGLLAVQRFPSGTGPADADIPPVFVDRPIADALHRDLARALRGDEITSAHQHAAEYWQWRAAGWPQDRHADLHDLLEARHHRHEAGDNDQAGAITEVVCAQLHAWGEVDHEAALIQETLAWLPPRSPLRAAWIHEIGKIAQVRGNHIEAERRYRQSLEMFTNIGDTAAVSRSQHRLGILAQARGDYAEAEHRYQQSGDLRGRQAPAAAESPGWPGGESPGWPGGESPGWPGGMPDGRSAESHPTVSVVRGTVSGGTVSWVSVSPGAVSPEMLSPDARPPRAGHTAPAGWRNRRVLCLVSSALATAAALVALSAAGVIQLTFYDGSGTPPGAGGLASVAAVRSQTAAWVARQISRSAILSCDPAMCAALRAQGVIAVNLVTLGPSSEDPLGSDVVIATAAVRNLFGSRLAGVYAPAVIAVFGLGRARIQIRVVAPYGAAAYRTALRSDLLAREAAGTQLLLNNEISVTASARKQLATGQVDSRLLITIAAIAAQHALSIIDFANSGPRAGPGIPLRSAEISAPGAAARQARGGLTLAARANARFLRSVLAFLRAQRPPFLAAILHTATIGDGQKAVQVGFAGPSPLGLLTAGNASADASPQAPSHYPRAGRPGQPGQEKRKL